MIFSDPGPSRGDWTFRFFGVPVRVHPWFWFTTLFMGATEDAKSVLIWVAVCFVSILIHEMGHVVAAGWFGERSEVVLYSFGGLAISRSGGRRSALEQMMISLAGPMAGFCLGAVVTLGTRLAGGKVFVSLMILIPTVQAYFVPSADTLYDHATAFYYLNVALNDLLWVNVYWGLFNLLPVYPLDGGQASQALLGTFKELLRDENFRLLGVAMAALGLLLDMDIVALFARRWQSAQALERHRPLSRPRSSWRR